MWVSFVPIATLAASADSEQPLQIEAGKFEAYKAENVSVFSDDVLITKGSIRITAQQARLQVIDGEVHRATIIGSPVEFQQQDDNGEFIRGWADRVEYDADKNLVDLTGNAKLHHGGDMFESETIRYDTLNQRVEAQSDETSEERVQIIFMPRKNAPVKQPGTGTDAAEPSPDTELPDPEATPDNENPDADAA